MFSLFFAPCNNMLMVDLCSLLWYKLIQTSITCVLYIRISSHASVVSKSSIKMCPSCNLAYILAELHVEVQYMEKLEGHIIPPQIKESGGRLTLINVKSYFSPKLLYMCVCMQIFIPASKHSWWCLHPSCFLLSPLSSKILPQISFLNQGTILFGKVARVYF